MNVCSSVCLSVKRWVIVSPWHLQLLRDLDIKGEKKIPQEIESDNSLGSQIMALNLLLYANFNYNPKYTPAHFHVAGYITELRFKSKKSVDKFQPHSRKSNIVKDIASVFYWSEAYQILTSRWYDRNTMHDFAIGHIRHTENFLFMTLR